MGIFGWLTEKKKKELELKWDEKLSVGVTELDAQHKKWFQIHNKLVDAMWQGVGLREMGPILSELADNAKLHFETEEAYMAKCAFPGLEPHRATHGAFWDRLSRIRADYYTGKPVLTAEVIEFLKEWLVSHVRDLDQRYAGHLREAGLQ